MEKKERGRERGGEREREREGRREGGRETSIFSKVTAINNGSCVNMYNTHSMHCVYGYNNNAQCGQYLLTTCGF